MKKIFFAAAFGMLATAMLTTSCVKDDFADPAPYNDTTSITRNTTISQLKGMHGTAVIPVPDSVIIEGVVISDDKAGNFYKQIYIQDESGGIEIKLGKTTIYNDFKRGQRVVVVCKGLSLGEYGGMKQLGSTYSPDGIMQVGGLETDYIISQHIFKKGKTLENVVPDTLTTLSDAYAGRLVSFKETKFKEIISALDNSPLTYADKNGSLVRSRNLVTKSGLAVTLRTSDFSAFAGVPVPTGSGTIVGVMSVYKSGSKTEFQLTIRDTADVVMNSPRF